MLLLVIVAVTTVLALTYALWDIDFSELGRLLSGGDYWVVAPFLALLAIFYWIKAIRWVLILKPVGQFSLSEVTPAMVIGYAGNNVLPAHLGELIRTVIFARRYGKSISSVATTLLVERVFDLIAILSLYAAGMAMIGAPPESLEIGAWFITLLVASFIVTIAIILYKPNLVLVFWDWIGTHLPGTLVKHVSGILHNVITAFSSLRSPSQVAVMIAWSVLKWSLMAAMVWLSLIAYGTDVSPAISMILLAVLALAAAIPNAPGYIGAIQAAYVFALRPFGVSEETAFAASVLFLVCQWVPVTAAGVTYFISGSLHVTELRREVEEAEEGTAS